VPIACVAAAARALGEQCRDAAECASGLCNTEGVCSSCAPTQGCGAACQPAYADGPSVCDPGRGRGGPGDACATNADCASETCTGAPRRQCLDGRRCASDANCPVDDDLVPGPCTVVGVQGGSCA
jgi:hypothetical protein